MAELSIPGFNPTLPPIKVDVGKAFDIPFNPYNFNPNDMFGYAPNFGLPTDKSNLPAGASGWNLYTGEPAFPKPSVDPRTLQDGTPHVSDWNDPDTGLVATAKGVGANLLGNAQTIGIYAALALLIIAGVVVVILPEGKTPIPIPV